MRAWMLTSRLRAGGQRVMMRGVPRLRVTAPLVLFYIFALAACGTATSSAHHRHALAGKMIAPGKLHAAAPPPTPTAEGTSSTPGIFQLPQMGFVSFQCDRAFRVRPFFDTRGVTSEEAVTIRAGNVTRRNFKTRTIGYSRGTPLRETTYSPDPVVALPYGHYGKVVITASTGTEARALSATVTALFVAGLVQKTGNPALGACYVKRWNVSMRVSPY